MKEYNFTFQKSLKHLLLIVAVIAIYTPATYAAKPTTLQPVSNLIVVDATGKKVGDVISLVSAIPTQGFSALVAFSVNSTLFTLIISSDSISGFIGSSSPIFYQSTDCSGTPLLEPSGNGNILPTTVTSAPGTTIYLAVPNSIPQCITIMSKWNGGCIVGQEQHCVVPATPLVDLDSLFTPPFSVQGK